MARDGSGNYSLYTPGNPVVTGTTISSTTFNNTMDDVATALTGSMARDGQSPPTANLPMGNNRLTGLGSATARTDAITAAQVQDSALIWGGTAGGTADAITVSTTPATAAHTTGAGFYFLSSAANTGAVTLNPNGVGAKAVTKNGSTALAAGDIPNGAIVRVVYDGIRYQLINADVRVDRAHTYTAHQGFGITTLSDSTSISWDASANQVAEVTLGGNRTLANPTNTVNGFTYILFVVQDATGSRTLAYGGNYRWPSGAAPVLTTSANAVDVITFIARDGKMYGVETLDFS